MLNQDQMIGTGAVLWTDLTFCRLTKEQVACPGVRAGRAARCGYRKTSSSR